MSAHKRALITPDSAALRRLDELSAQLRVTSRPAPALISAARQETRAELKRVTLQAQRRQAEVNGLLDEHLASLGGRLINLARATEVALESQNQQLQALAQENASHRAVSDEFESYLELQAVQFASLLAQSNSQWQEDVSDLEHQVQRQRRQKRVSQEAAVQALHQSQELLDLLQQAFPQGQDFNQVQPLLIQAQQNLEDGFAEAALVTAQQVAWQMQMLRLQVEQDLNERNLLRLAASEKLAMIQAALVTNEEVSAIDMEGRTLDYPLNLDFWTEGGWTRLNEALQPIRDYLSQPAEVLSKADLDELTHHSLPSIENAIPGLVAQARRAVLASQLRFNMAEAVVQALGEQGFVPEQASYQDGDVRQAYQLALHNLEGSELVVTLQPKPESMQNQIDMQSQDAKQRTPHELRQRARELARSLRRYGLQIFNPSTSMAGEASPSYPSSLQEHAYQGNRQKNQRRHTSQAAPSR